MTYEKYKRVLEGLAESKFKFLSPTKIEIVNASIVYRDFSGSAYGPNNRSVTIAITPEFAAELDKCGYPYRKIGVKDENGEINEDMSILTIQPRLRYRSGLTGLPVAYPPTVSFFNANGTEVQLSEETVNTLDHARLSKCCFTINYYERKDGKGWVCSIQKFKSVMEPFVEYDGIFDEYYNNGAQGAGAAVGVDDDQTPFDL